jgi:diguanylate cyclase (GGDEF)-like protein
MGNGAANWRRRAARTMLAFCLLFSALCYARPLPVAFQCTLNVPSSPALLPESAWQNAPSGNVQLKSAFSACWIRVLELPGAGEHLTIRSPWANVTVLDAQGNVLAAGSRGGAHNHAMVTANHVIVPVQTGWTAPLYLRLPTRMNDIPIPSRVSVESQDGGTVMEEDRRQTYISLAVAVAVLVIAFFSTAFSVVLRDVAYAWMGMYLLMTVIIRVFNSGEPLIFSLSNNFDHARAISRLMYPVINAVWMLAYARMGDFAIHAPRINRLCQVTAVLFLLQIPLWFFDGAPGQALNVGLILLLTYPLLFGGCWIAWRKGSVAAGILLLSNLMLAVFWGPGQFNFIFPTEPVTRFIESSTQFGSLSSMLGVASDLLMPVLFSVALAMRTRSLKHAALRLMSYDALTGLPNRENIRRVGTAMLARNPKLAVLVLNIERFRSINGALGPEIGDQLLVVTGKRLAAIEGATVGRLHADQFCLLWPDMETVPALHERIERGFARPVDVHGQMVDLTLSIGVAYASAVPGTIAQLLRRAETALDAGRVLHLSWVEYRAELEHDMRADLGLLSELSRAVEEGELRMFLQPKVHLPDGDVTSAEALVRWQHPVRGNVPPVEFIPFAEQTGRIHLITQWMLGQAMRLCAQLRAQGTPLQISVNISTADLAKTGFVEGVEALCTQCGALPGDIRLEVTESGAMHDPAAALLIMHALRNAGFSLSIDDFGTGYSSLAYLQKMPVAELKIDRSFIRDVVAGTDAAVLLESTIELGHRLGLSVVAEGAETAAEWELLVALGCDYVQGYFAAKPMPVEEFLSWRERRGPFRTQPDRMANGPSSDRFDLAQDRS